MPAKTVRTFSISLFAMGSSPVLGLVEYAKVRLAGLL